jgi:hypothetical protein
MDLEYVYFKLEYIRPLLFLHFLICFVAFAVWSLVGNSRLTGQLGAVACNTYSHCNAYVADIFAACS